MFINPSEVIKNFELRHSMTVADFGSGLGHYVLEAAKRVGESGVVYAIDIQKNLLEKIKSEAGKNNLSNVEIIWADIEGEQGSKLATGTIDFVIASNIMFQLKNKETLAKEIGRVLKNGGKTAVINWDDSLGVTGVPAAAAFPRKETERIFLQEGFLEEREFPAGDSHYGLIFKKS